MARKRIGSLLEEKGLINEFQLVAALSHQRKWKIKLGKSLIELGYLEEGPLYQVLAEQLELELVDLKKKDIPYEILGRLSREQGRNFLAVPIDQESEALVFAVAEPDRPALKEELEKITGQPVRLVLATESDVEARIRKLPEKISVATVQPVKKVFRRNQEGDIEPIEEKLEPEAAEEFPPATELAPEQVSPEDAPGVSDEQKEEVVTTDQGPESVKQEGLQTVIPEPVTGEPQLSTPQTPEALQEATAPAEPEPTSAETVPLKLEPDEAITETPQASTETEVIEIPPSPDEETAPVELEPGESAPERAQPPSETAVSEVPPVEESKPVEIGPEEGTPEQPYPLESAPEEHSPDASTVPDIETEIQGSQEEAIPLEEKASETAPLEIGTSVDKEQAPADETVVPEEKEQEPEPLPVEMESPVEVPPLEEPEASSEVELPSMDIPSLDTTVEPVSEEKAQEALPKTLEQKDTAPSMEDFFPGQVREPQEPEKEPLPEEDVEEVSLKDEEPVPLEGADEEPVEAGTMPGLVTEETAAAGIELQEELKETMDQQEGPAEGTEDIQKLRSRAEELEVTLEKATKELAEIKEKLGSHKKD
jgi:hypothetical protein